MTVKIDMGRDLKSNTEKGNKTKTQEWYMTHNKNKKQWDNHPGGEKKEDAAFATKEQQKDSNRNLGPDTQNTDRHITNN